MPEAGATVNELGVPLVSDDELKAQHCLEKRTDRVSGEPDVTAFKRWARLHQAHWREAQEFPIGSQPYRPKPDETSRPIGSRIEYGYNAEPGTVFSDANFLTKTAFGSAKSRVLNPQPGQMLRVDRLFYDLLSSMPMCFNIFGEIAQDLDLADRAVHEWWADVPGRVIDVRFEWSPGRWVRREYGDEYLGNRSAFDVAFELDMGDGTHGVLGVETKYHEHCEKPSKPSADYRCRRYKEVALNSGALTQKATQEILGTDLEQICLDHLLAASMPLHPSKKWSWAGFALVHPAGNPSYARAAKRYAELLQTGAAIHVNTIESLLDAGVLPSDVTSALKRRYLPVIDKIDAHVGVQHEHQRMSSRP